MSVLHTFLLEKPTILFSRNLNLCNKISTRKIYNIGKSVKFYSMRKVNLVAALKGVRVLGC